jgi:hypothetical protein
MHVLVVRGLYLVSIGFLLGSNCLLCVGTMSAVCRVFCPELSLWGVPGLGSTWVGLRMCPCVGVGVLLVCVTVAIWPPVIYITRCGVVGMCVEGAS